MIAPPFTLLDRLGRRTRRIRRPAGGARTSTPNESGAFTGEMAPGMLVDVGCAYAIVGHSERRALSARLTRVRRAQGRRAARPTTSGRSSASARRSSSARRDRHLRAWSESAARAAAWPGSPDSRGPRGRDRLRAGLGDRHRPHGDAGDRPGGPRASSASSFRPSSGRPGIACGSSTGAPSSRKPCTI